MLSLARSVTTSVFFGGTVRLYSVLKISTDLVTNTFIQSMQATFMTILSLEVSCKLSKSFTSLSNTCNKQSIKDKLFGFAFVTKLN